MIVIALLKGGNKGGCLCERAIGVIHLDLAT